MRKKIFSAKINFDEKDFLIYSEKRNYQEKRFPRKLIDRKKFQYIYVIPFSGKNSKNVSLYTHCIPVINIVKKYQLNSTGMNFLFTDFLTTKF